MTSASEVLDILAVYKLLLLGCIAVLCM